MKRLHEFLMDEFGPMGYGVLLFAALCAATIVSGCTSNSAPKSSDIEPEKNITYFKDTRTGVCYAAMNSLDGHSGWKTTSITYVPCNSEVERLIGQ